MYKITLRNFYLQVKLIILVQCRLNHNHKMNKSVWFLSQADMNWVGAYNSKQVYGLIQLYLKKIEAQAFLTWLAREPWTGGVAKNFMSGQRLYLPSLQSWHRQQLIPGSNATRSPGARDFTSEPTSSMIPAHSWPITIGSFTIKCAHLNFWK